MHTNNFVWYFPSFSGDLRLAPDAEDPNKTVLSIIEPTPEEERVLDKLGATFLARGYVEEWTTRRPGFLARLVGKKHEVTLDAPIASVAPLVVANFRPGPAVLTAITFKGGQVITTSGDTDEVAALAEAVCGDSSPAKVVEAVRVAEVMPEPAPKAAKSAEEPAAAATVRRPTPCCPACRPGAVEPASDVLLSFLSVEEHETWAKARFIIVEGGLSGHRYALAHRHSSLAQHVGRICYDLDARCVVHFHDWRVPPEEEVLAAKLILQHREPWLRNEATMFETNGQAKRPLVFKNPFGDIMDGVADARWTQHIGRDFEREVVREFTRVGLRALVA